MKFIVEGEPIGKQRPRYAYGHMYTPKKTKDYERKILEAYNKTGFEMINGYISVDVYAFYKIPKSVTKKQKEQMIKGEILPVVKPDLDNVIKCVLDALNGIAFKDDKDVITVTGIKKYSENPRIVVYINSL